MKDTPTYYATKDGYTIADTESHSVSECWNKIAGITSVAMSSKKMIKEGYKVIRKGEKDATPQP